MATASECSPRGTGLAAGSPLGSKDPAVWQRDEMRTSGPALRPCLPSWRCGQLLSMAFRSLVVWPRRHHRMTGTNTVPSTSPGPRHTLQPCHVLIWAAPVPCQPLPLLPPWLRVCSFISFKPRSPGPSQGRGSCGTRSMCPSTASWHLFPVGASSQNSLPNPCVGLLGNGHDFRRGA